MSLQEEILDIQNKIKNNQYPNEQSISQGIVLRLLGTMKWPIYDTQMVIPEYPVPWGRVDFALCAKKNKPVIFIEVKQPGKTFGADEQLFNYAFHQGTPFVIVTDGTEWHFYLPSGVGSYEERRVYKLDLIERDAHESEYRLERYLSFDEVVSEDALEHALEDYKNVSKERSATENIPTAWEKLLEEKEEKLMDTVSKKVESLCGYKPTQEQIINYLNSLKPNVLDFHPTPTKREESIYTQPVKRENGIYTKKSGRNKIKVTFPDGVVICDQKVVQTMIKVLRKIGFIKVGALGIMQSGLPLVSKEQHTTGSYTWNDAGSGFFLYMCFNTSKKLELLNRINRELDLGLKIELV